MKRVGRGRRIREKAGKQRTDSDRWRDDEGQIYCKKRQMSKRAGRRSGGDGRGRGQGEREEG